jgi:hypothetical protein
MQNANLKVQIAKFDDLAKSRHSGENDPPQADRELITTSKNWIPAFAGMTESRFFRLFTS